MSESDQIAPGAAYDARIDVREVFRTLWAGKWVIGGITFAGIVISTTVALMLPNIYRADALLAPNQEQNVGGLSALAAQYGGLASLAGINLANESSDKTALGLEILKSRKFISEFIERHDILVPLMAARGWDPGTGELEIDGRVYDESASAWVRSAKAPRISTPSLQEAYEKFSDNNLSITQNKKTGFISISIEHLSPIVAKQWVDWLVQDINTTVMRQDVDEAEQAIAYLEEQINATALADLQNVFFQLIEEQTKTVMLAKVTSEYLFRTIDPAVVPELKAKPRRAWIVALGLFIGGAVGIFVVLIQSRSGRQRG